MIDYSNNPECRGIEPEVFWVVKNDGVPIQAQGFFGAWEGRDTDYWFPEAQFTSKRPWIYDTRQEAVDEARRRLEGKRATLDVLAEYIDAVERGDHG